MMITEDCWSDFSKSGLRLSGEVVNFEVNQHTHHITAIFDILSPMKKDRRTSPFI